MRYSATTMGRRLLARGQASHLCQSSRSSAHRHHARSKLTANNVVLISTSVWGCAKTLKAALPQISKATLVMGPVICPPEQRQRVWASLEESGSVDGRQRSLPSWVLLTLIGFDWVALILASISVEVVFTRIAKHIGALSACGVDLDCGNRSNQSMLD